MRSHEVKVELSSLLLRVRSHKLLSTRTKYCQRQDVSMSSSSPMRASGDGNDSAATTQNYLFIGKHSFRLGFSISSCMYLGILASSYTPINCTD